MELVDYQVAVPAEWIDYNHHLTEGCYGVAFANAGDWVLEQTGFHLDYRARERRTFYTAEVHTWFRREVAEGAHLTVRTTVLGADTHRMHLLHEMIVAGETCAYQEAMLLHVDVDRGRVTPMAPEMEQQLAALVAAHAARERPAFIGAGVRGMPAR